MLIAPLPTKATRLSTPTKIVDLSSHLSGDGRLDWDVPPGRWTILRFGHTPTGASTKHGKREGLGLECDKLSAEATTVQYKNYFGRILKEIKTVPGARLSGMNVDSAESGSQNWTGDFPAQFKQRHGYDLLRYLPAMAGRVVGSPELSGRVLFDVRRTIADVMSDEYFGTFEKLCHADGATLMAQAPGIAAGMPCDNIGSKGRVDIPMGEFWYSQHNGTMDCKEAACAAHLYGHQIAAAESFTGTGATAYPATEKPISDAALALGINRFVVLSYTHQPYEDQKPGVVEPRLILSFQRNNTWWEYSGGFWNTLARSCALMQQGQPVIDVLYHLGNDTPTKIATWRMRPVPPAGYDYDVCSDEILLRASVKDGRLVLPGGMSYRMLVLAGGDHMTLAAARQVEALVKAGATILGPIQAGRLARASETAPMATRKFGASPMNSGGRMPPMAPENARPDWGRWSGAGRRLTSWQRSTPRRISTPAERTWTSSTPTSRSGKDDIYYLANHRDTPASFTGVFRVAGGTPQAWNPETGTISALPGAVRQGPVTTVPMHLEPHESLFVVFRDGPPPATLAPGLVEDLPVWQTLAGAWDVSFDPKWGGPAHADFPQPHFLDGLS